MEDVKQNEYSFRITIKLPDKFKAFHPDDLLGRDYTYTLNIKTVDANGNPVVGIQYTINANKKDAHLHNVATSIEEGKVYSSIRDGEDFSISGSPALSAEDFPLMEYDFAVTCTATLGSVSGSRTFKIGRLMKWGRPLISVASGSSQAVFKTKTEWFGDHTPGAMWNWGETIEHCILEIPTLEVSATTPAQRNTDGSVACDNLMELSKFASATRAKVVLKDGISKNGYTAVMAHAEELELYYVKSVEFEAPSAIVDVETQVTCVLFGLNGKPRANESVNWSADAEQILDLETSTNANGVATTRFKAKESGDAKVTATAAHPYISGVTPSTLTGPLEIVSKNASATEYVVGHSSAINFSVMLAVKGHVPPRTKVQWSVEGEPPKESESDNTGKAAITFDFKAGEHTVSAKLSNGLWVTFSVKAFDVVIAKKDPPASIDFVVAHSAPVVFKAWLTAGGNPLANKKVNWLVDNTNKGVVTSDSQGMVTHTETFAAAGDHSVIVEVHNTSQRQTFPVKAYNMVIADHAPKTSNYVLGVSKSTQFSVTLKAGEKLMPDVDVKWAKDGAASGTSKTGASGVAYIQKDFTTKGSHTVTATIDKTPSQVATYAVTAYEVAIEKKEPTTAVDYIIGHTPELTFAVWLAAAGGAQANAQVEWGVDGNKEKDTLTDSAGRTSYSAKGFGVTGERKVTAKVVLSGHSVEFPFNVYRVGITEPSVSNAEYIIKYSADVEFTAILKAGTKALSGVEVEWTVGSATVKSKSDGNGKVTFRKGFDTPGNHTVTLKEPKSGASNSFTVNASQMEITEPYVSDPEYIISHSPDVEFSAVLKAGTRKLSGIDVEWTVGGTTVKNKSDGNGKVTFRKGFDTPGNHTVTLKEPKSGASKIFTVNACQVEITEPYISDPEYIINHSPDVEFSAVLRAGTRKLSGIEVEWKVGDTTVKSKSDGNGKVTFRKGFDAVGEFTIIAKEPKSGKFVSLKVTTSVLEMTEPHASATEYIVGYTPTAVFSVVLKAGGKPLSGIEVGWSVDGIKVSDIESDASGKVIFRRGFSSEGNVKITAQEPKSGKSVSFNLPVSFYVAEVRWRASYESDLLPNHPDLRFRLAPYVMNVRLLSNRGVPLSGIFFRLSAEGNWREMGIEISGVDQEVASSVGGFDFGVSSIYSSEPVELKLRLSGDGRTFWSHSYRMGWLYALAGCERGSRTLDFFYYPSGLDHQPGQPPSQFLFGIVEVTLPDRNLHLTHWVRLDSGAGQLRVMIMGSNQFYAGDRVITSSVVTDDGYLAMRAGELILK